MTNVTRYRFLPIISAALILFFGISCSSEFNKEPAVGIENKSKSPTQKSTTAIREVIVPPALSLIGSPVLNQNNLVSFGFKSTKAGTISYSGSCISSTRNAIKGDHHIRFVAMVQGYYDDCAIKVTDSDGNRSKPLRVPPFKVDFTVPELNQIGDLKVEGRNVEVELKSSEAGNLFYSGNCKDDLLYAKKGKSEITLSFPGDGHYSDCELSLADVAGNVSEPLSLGTVRIDTTPAALTEIKPVPEKIQTDRPSYSFKTSKSGNLTFSGKCKGNVDKAVVGINHISLLTGEPGTYDDCTLTLIDSSKNQSLPLKISPFEVLGNS